MALPVRGIFLVLYFAKRAVYMARFELAKVLPGKDSEKRVFRIYVTYT